MFFKKFIKMKFLLILTLTSCSSPTPQQEDYLGLYEVIKVRENGTILNIDTLSQVELTEELYISSIDRNGDFLFSNNEIMATSYDFQISENNKPVLKINDNETLVELIPDHYYDLLLKRIDPFGNETIMYLKK